MATHSSILAWRIPWTEEPGRLQSTGVPKSLTQLSDFTFTFTFPVHHQLLDLAQTHVHPVHDAIQPSFPLSSPSPPTFNLSQQQRLVQ